MPNMARDAQIRTEGRGGIVLTQFALSDPELDTAYLTNDLFSTTDVYFNGSNNKRYSFSNNEMEILFGIMQGKANLNAKLLGAIVVIYVILVGPVLYLVLKKYDKREKIWYAVPVMSVVFVLIIFMASRGFAIKNRMFETIRVAKADGSGKEADYIFGFSSSQSSGRSIWMMIRKSPDRSVREIITAMVMMTSISVWLPEILRVCRFPTARIACLKVPFSRARRRTRMNMETFLLTWK